MASSSVSDRTAQAVARLEQGPADLNTLTVAAAGFETQGDPQTALALYEALAACAREAGEPALAVFSALSVTRLGDARRGHALLGSIVDAYAAGSPRLDSALVRRAPGPPAQPQRVAAGAGTAKLAQRAKVVARRLLTEANAAAKHAGKLPVAALFSTLDDLSFRELVSVCEAIVYAPGSVVIETGHVAQALYVVAHGSLSVRREPHALGHLRAGMFFGEIALLGGTTRTATVTSEAHTWVLCFPKHALEAAAKQAPSLADTLAAYARRRLLNNVMRTSEIFTRLSPDEREQILARFSLALFDAGQVIVAQGENSRALHVVVSGQASVERDGERVASLAAGDVFGEMSLIGRKAATASVIADTKLVAFLLPGDDFDEIALAHPALLSEMYKILVERETETPASWLLIDDNDEQIIV